MHTARNPKYSRTKPTLFWLDIGSELFQSFWTTSSFGLRRFAVDFFIKKLCQSTERKTSTRADYLEDFY
jgi:hypothetical protein